ncbi:MAG: hypothetical protein V3U59_00910 [Gammaproteobacteria bacterium]
MRFRDPLSIAAALLCCGTTSAAETDDDGFFDDVYIGPRYLVTAASEFDNDSGYGFFGGLSYGLIDRTWLNFSGGFTNGEDSQTQINTVDAAIGISHDGETGGVSASYTYWGDPDELDRVALHVRGYLRNGPWRLALDTEFREYTLTFRIPRLVLPPIERRGDIGSDGFGFDVSRWGSDWSWYLNGIWYDYDADLSGLNTDVALIVLSSPH